MIRRISKLFVAALLFSGCSDDGGEEAPQAKDPVCLYGSVQGLRPADDSDEPGGHWLWCGNEGGFTDGEWVTLHDDGSLASRGRITDGIRGQVSYARWSTGKDALRTEGDEWVILNESGEEEVRLKWSTVDGCFERAAPVKEERANWCEAVGEDDEMEKHGVQRTWHPDGQLESFTTFVEGKQQGLFLAFHANGRRWVEGEHNMGKRHGPWRTWYPDGRPYQVGSKEPEPWPPAMDQSAHDGKLKPAPPETPEESPDTKEIEEDIEK